MIKYLFMGAAVLVLAGMWASRVQSARDRETRRQLQAAVAPTDRIFHPGDLAGLHLPAVVEEYLANALPAGRRWPNLVRVRQEGEFRLGPEKPWLKLKAEQFFTLTPPGFVWQARINQTRGLWLTARDSYLEGRGSFQGKLWGLLPLVRGVGREADISSLIRYVSEAVWFPFALVPGNGCRWEEAGPDAARVILTDHGLEISGVFSFDAAGEINSFFTTERFLDQTGGPVRTDWSVEYFDYETFEGMRLPTRGTAIWHLPGGPMPYVRLRVVGLEFVSAGKDI